MALCQRGILDRGRISRRTGADCFVAGRAWYRIYRSRCTILDATIGSDANNGLAGRRRPYGLTFGVILFKRSIHGRLQLSHLVGIGLLLLLVPVAMLLSPLLLSTAATIVLLIVAGWEAWSLRSHTELKPEIEKP